MKRALLLLGLAMLAAPAAAQDAKDFASGCADDSGGDRCSDTAVKAWRELYGLAPVEAMAAEGSTVRRVLFVDGYGRDVLAISAIRAKGAPPVIEIRQPRDKDGSLPPARIRPIAEAAWDRILRDAATAHRRFAPEARTGEEITICLHAWVSRFESADPRRLSPNVVGKMWLEPESAAMTASACYDNPTYRFGTTLAEVAADTLGECSSIDADRMRNGIALIEACMDVRGDTIATGNAMAAQHKLTMLIYRSSQARQSWTDMLRNDPTLASQDLKKKADVDWNLLRRTFVAADFIYFDPDIVNGIDSQHVRSIGTISWSIRDKSRSEPKRHQRKVQFDWVEEASRWVIDDIRLLD